MKRRSFQVAGLATTAVVAHGLRRHVKQHEHHTRLAFLRPRGRSQGWNPATSCPAPPPSTGTTLARLRRRESSSTGNRRLFTRTLVSWAPSPPTPRWPSSLPSMATDTGKVSTDGMTWTFTLKDGLKWEDGSEITADDVKYGVSRTFAVDVITRWPQTSAIAFSTSATLADGLLRLQGPVRQDGSGPVRQGRHRLRQDHHGSSSSKSV